jgi:hypothetical protein
MTKGNIIISNKLKAVKSSPHIESLGINVKLAHDVIQTIENFKKEFLSETKQKNKET